MMEEIKPVKKPPVASKPSMKRKSQPPILAPKPIVEEKITIETYEKGPNLSMVPPVKPKPHIINSSDVDSRGTSNSEVVKSLSEKSSDNAVGQALRPSPSPRSASQNRSNSDLSPPSRQKKPLRPALPPPRPPSIVSHKPTVVASDEKSSSTGVGDEVKNRASSPKPSTSHLAPQAQISENPKPPSSRPLPELPVTAKPKPSKIRPEHRSVAAHIKKPDTNGSEKSTGKKPRPVISIVDARPMSEVGFRGSTPISHVPPKPSVSQLTSTKPTVKPSVSQPISTETTVKPSVSQPISTETTVKQVQKEPRQSPSELPIPVPRARKQDTGSKVDDEDSDESNQPRPTVKPRASKESEDIYSEIISTELDNMPPAKPGRSTFYTKTTTTTTTVERRSNKKSKSGSKFYTSSVVERRDVQHRLESKPIKPKEVPARPQSTVGGVPRQLPSSTSSVSTTKPVKPPSRPPSRPPSISDEKLRKPSDRHSAIGSTAESATSPTKRPDQVLRPPAAFSPPSGNPQRPPSRPSTAPIGDSRCSPARPKSIPPPRPEQAPPKPHESEHFKSPIDVVSNTNPSKVQEGITISASVLECDANEHIAPPIPTVRTRTKGSNKECMGHESDLHSEVNESCDRDDTSDSYHSADMKIRRIRPTIIRRSMLIKESDEVETDRAHCTSPEEKNDRPSETDINITKVVEVQSTNTKSSRPGKELAVSSPEVGGGQHSVDNTTNCPETRIKNTKTVSQKKVAPGRPTKPPSRPPMPRHGIPKTTHKATPVSKVVGVQESELESVVAISLKQADCVSNVSESMDESKTAFKICKSDSEHSSKEAVVSNVESPRGSCVHIVSTSEGDTRHRHSIDSVGSQESNVPTGERNSALESESKDCRTISSDKSSLPRSSVSIDFDDDFLNPLENSDSLSTELMSAFDHALHGSEESPTDTQEAPEKSPIDLLKAPEESQTNTQKAPEESKADTQKTPEDSQADTQKTPEDSQADTKKTPEDSQADTKKTPEDSQADTQKTPENSQADTQKTPEDSQADTQNTPEDSQADTQKTPENSQKFYKSGTNAEKEETKDVVRHTVSERGSRESHSPLKSKRTSLRCVVAVHAFKPENGDELELKVDDEITVEEVVNDEWMFGSCNGNRGLFPVSFVAEKSIPMSDASNSSSPVTLDMSTPKRFVAVFDCDSSTKGDLCFKKAEIIEFVSDVNLDWILGRSVRDSSEGILPRCLVQECPSDVITACRAGFDFDGMDGELNFKVGDIVLIIGRVNENWLFGSCDGKRGNFPVSYVLDLQSDLNIPYI